MQLAPVLQSKTKNKEIIVEVFKTNINSHLSAQLVVRKLREILPGAKINVDVEDCDKVLRIETNEPGINVWSVMECVRKINFEIELLL